MALHVGQGYEGACMALDPSGLYLVTVCTARDKSGSTLCLWEAATGNMIDCVRHLPTIASVAFTCDNQGIVAGCHGGALLLLHLPPQLTRDAVFVLLGAAPSPFLDSRSPSAQSTSTPSDASDTTSDAPLRRPQAASGMERHERLSTVPDLLARVLPATSGTSLLNVWSDKAIWLPDLPP